MSGFTAKFWTFWRHVVDLFFMITWTVLTSISIERKANCTCTIMSFTWSVLVWNIALDQSVHEKSFSYCKNFFFNKLSIIFTLLLQYYYNSATGQFLYWNAETQQYIPVAADGWVKLCLAMDVNFKIPDSFKWTVKHASGFRSAVKGDNQPASNSVFVFLLILSNLVEE